MTLWSFIRKKQAHLKPGERDGGDAWTWTAIDRASRLVVAFHVGGRTEGDARVFALDLRSRLVTMPQLTSDGLMSYALAVARSQEKPPGPPRSAILAG